MRRDNTLGPARTGPAPAKTRLTNPDSTIGATRMVTADRRILAEQLHQAVILYAEAAGLQAQLRVQAWREGYAAGIADIQRDYERGWADAIAHMKQAEQRIARALTQPPRWSVRGQQRTRDTFSQPHPRDYKGRAS